MRFLIDAGMPRATATLMRSRGHDVLDVRDDGGGLRSDESIAEQCLRESRCLITRDFDFADIRTYPPELYHGIVVFKLPDSASRDFILALVTEFLSMEDILRILDRRLAIVEVDRVRLRPAD